jgi:hypothetical protein
MGYLLKKFQKPYFTIKTNSWNTIKDEFIACAENKGVKVESETKSNFKNYLKIYVSSKDLSQKQEDLVRPKIFQTNIRHLLQR